MQCHQWRLVAPAQLEHTLYGIEDAGGVCCILKSKPVPFHQM